MPVLACWGCCDEKDFMSARVGAIVFSPIQYIPRVPGSYFSVLCYSVQPYTLIYRVPGSYFSDFSVLLYHIIETLSLTTDRAMALLWGSAPDPVAPPPNPPKGLRRMSMVRVVKWCCEYGAARSSRTEEIRCLKHRKTFSYWRLRFDDIYNEK